MSVARVGAIELGGTKVRCALYEGTEKRDEVRIATRDFDTTMTDVEAFFSPLRVNRLGVAAFGPLELDPGSDDYGSLLETPKPGWSRAPLLPRLRANLRVPLAIDTDVNAAALAEQKLGAGQGADPCVYITVGTGVGVGAVIHGRTLHGLMHGELGHLPAPRLCDFEGACPFHGRCIEGVVSGHALALRTGGRAISDDDPLWDLSARYLAHLVVALVLGLSPRRIVLGGGVMQRAGLLQRVRDHVPALLHGYVPRSELSSAGLVHYLVAPGLGEDAGLVGARLLAEEFAP